MSQLSTNNYDLLTGLIADKKMDRYLSIKVNFKYCAFSSNQQDIA